MIRNSNTSTLATSLSLLFLASSAQSALIVYEGFDYLEGSDLPSLNGGEGWAGGWSGGNWDVISGQSFGDVAVSGGAVQRPSRSGNAATSRVVSTTAQPSLVGDGSTIWFSVLLQGTGSPAADSLATAGFATNTWGTIVFGDTALTGGSGVGPAPIGAGGNAIGVGFRGGNGLSFDDLQIQGVVYDGGTASTTTDAASPTIGSDTVLIVGSVQWSASGTDDILTLYNVIDPAAALPTAFTTLTADLDQSTFNVVSIGDAQTSIYDEIRFGTELIDVLAIPEPTSASLVGLAFLGFLRRKRG